MTLHSTILKLSLVITFVACASSSVIAQVFQTGGLDYSRAPKDSLRLLHEWWVGADLSGYYAMHYGALTINHIGGEAPGSPFQKTETTGGSGYGFSLAASVEYRPFFEKLGLLGNLGIQWTSASTYNDNVRTGEEFANNATYQANNTVIYANLGINARYMLNPYGLFLIGGFSIDIPVSVAESYIWQIETQTTTNNPEVPGTPNTNIRFSTHPNFSTRVGLNIGAGYDFLAGLFGYRRQLLTPYMMLNASTPAVSEPTSWGNISLRAGVIWRYGF